LQTHLYIWKSLHRDKLLRLFRKIGMAMASGLLVAVLTIGVYTSGVSAQILRASCARGDRGYKVVWGDTLGKIAFQYHTRWTTLAAHNHLARPNLIYSGQVICVPGGATVPRYRSKHTTSGRSRDVASRHRSKHATSRQKHPALVRNPVPIGYSNVFPYPTCTWWADQRYYQLHRYFVPWRTNAMAWQWSARAQQFRWNVSARPSIGSIVNMQPWTQGALGSGHVAVVERVLRGGTVVASSMNWGANPYAVVYTQIRPGSGITFIRR
jgi:surface antigen